MKSRERSDDRRKRRTARPALEAMETRQLLSQMGLGHMQHTGNIQKPGHLQTFAHHAPPDQFLPSTFRTSSEGLSQSVLPGDAAVATSLLQLPDLTTRIYFTGSGASLNINVVITNQGTAAAYNVGLQVTQKDLKVQDRIARSVAAAVSVIRPGQSVTWTANVASFFGRPNNTGNMVYTATADPNNLIVESNETNNSSQAYA
jgi:hypothetical protein